MQPVRMARGFFRAAPFLQHQRRDAAKLRILGFGADIAGRIEEVGPDTKTFKIGDAVFGDLSLNDFGGLAEYVAAPEILLAAKPDTVSFEQASAVPMASLTRVLSFRETNTGRPGVASEHERTP